MDILEDKNNQNFLLEWAQVTQNKRCSEITESPGATGYNSSLGDLEDTVMYVISMSSDTLKCIFWLVLFLPSFLGHLS